MKEKLISGVGGGWDGRRKSGRSGWWLSKSRDLLPPAKSI